MNNPPPSPINERLEAVPLRKDSAAAAMRADRDLVRDLMADGGGRHPEVPDERRITSGEVVDDLMDEDPTAIIDLLRQATRLPQTLHVEAEKALLRIRERGHIGVVVTALRTNTKLLFAVHAAMAQSREEENGVQIAS
ncbi:hypothetical protein HZA43_05560 [Candidatus Peregrinibacteria bacterium]|nr:hypothetical protein [Candidatus Peregrinibacteria bacterium]